MVNPTITTISGEVDSKEKSAVDIDYALDVAGLGWYNIKYCLTLVLFLIAAIIEPVGYSFVLPAARCDLDMTDTQRGIIGSIPYIGVVITSFPWGYLVDTRGRKRMVVISSTIAGVLGVVSAFMPDLISFVLMKLLMSLCIACPAAVPYSFVGELLPTRYRDITLSVTNALQMFGATLVPLFGWAILPLDFRVDFGAYDFRPWRLLTIVNALPFLLGAFLMSFGPESPKYLMAQGKHDESLKVLQTMYAVNKRQRPEDYPIKYLNMPEDSKKEKPSFLKSLLVQSAPLVKPPYVQWMLLNGILLFGVYATINGLNMWLPDVLNRVLTGGQGGQTACEVIAQRLNETDLNAECDDSISYQTFLINSIANLCCAIIATIVSSTVKLIGKKVLLVSVLLLIGTFCILINFVTQQILFAILLSAQPLASLAIGPINAYAVQIFPTHLRGMAVSLSMMIGRTGSIVGSNVAGALINAVCEATFYTFGGLLILCGLLSLLLPGAKKSDNKAENTKFAIIENNEVESK